MVHTPPLCTWRDMNDGSVSMEDLADFLDVIAELSEARKPKPEARNAAPMMIGG